MEGYLDFLTNNGERYYPFVRVEGIIDTDGTAFSNWIAKMNIHNHDVRYAAAAHNHDTRYSMRSHTHTEYATLNHEHNYAGSDTAGGVATSAAKLATAINLTFEGAISGTVSLDGSTDITIPTTVNHNHDTDYISTRGGSAINLSDSENAFTISGSADTTKVLMNNGGESYGTLGYTDRGIYLSYNDKIFRVNGDGVYYNESKLADEQFVLDNMGGGGGGSIDMDLLKSLFADKAHTHTTLDITDMPDKLANPNPITFSINGTDTVYDGSSATNILIDPSALGCAMANHDHDYSTVYASLEHYHDSNYLALDGSNSISASKIDVQTPTLEDLGENVSTTKYLNFTSSKGTPMAMVGNIGAMYTKDGENIRVSNVFLSAANHEGTTRLTVSIDGAFINNQQLLDQSMLGHKDESYTGISINADKLDGYHSGDFIKNANVIKLGDEARSQLDIDTSGTQGLDLLFRNANGYYMSIKTKDSTLESSMEIQSNGETLFMITRDKSTGATRTDMFGTLYMNGKPVPF